MDDDREATEVLAEASQLYDQYLQLTALTTLTELPNEAAAPEFAAPLPAPLGLALGNH